MTRLSSQHGAVLIVALILLVLITLTGVSTASLINSNTKVLDNFEARAAVESAAISALQQAIARGTLVSTDVVFANPCTTSRTTCIDANGDGALVAGQDILVILFFHRAKFKILEEDFLKEILAVELQPLMVKAY